MGKKKISLKKKTAICALLKTGNHSMREIVRNKKANHCVMVLLAKKHKGNSAVTLTYRAHCERKRKTILRTDRKIVQIVCDRRKARESR